MELDSLSINISSHFWVFLQALHFLDQDIYRYTLPYERNVTIINYAVINNNIFLRDNRIMNEGVGTDFVRCVTRREFSAAKIFEPRQRLAVKVQESAALKRQAAEEARILDKAGKAKIRLDQEVKVAELRKQQLAEKQVLIERHKQDAELVRQVAQKEKLAEQARLAQKAKEAKEARLAKKAKKAPPVKKKDWGSALIRTPMPGVC
jgi:DNA polymerase III alpha subunit (gram-positive type)